MDKDDLRYQSAGYTISDYIANKYSRKNHKIGEPIYQSHISRDILTNFSFSPFTGFLTFISKYSLNNSSSTTLGTSISLGLFK